jgi:hypothetical protein
MLACGSSDGGTPSPPEQCDEFLNTYCGRAADCLSQLGCDPGFTREQENEALERRDRGLLDPGPARELALAETLKLTRVCVSFLRNIVTRGSHALKPFPR